MRVLNDLDGIEDLAGSMGRPGNPDHPDVIAVTQNITGAIQARGKKLSEEVIVAARGSHIFLNALREFAGEAPWEAIYDSSPCSDSSWEYEISSSLQVTNK